MLKGIDISNWQGDANLGAVSNTQDFVIIKASEGVGYKDPRFEEYRAELRKLNILRGFYHFARTDLNNSPENEADWFLSAVGELQEGELLVLDFEVPAPDPVGWCKSFLDHLSERLGGYKPLVYLNNFTVNSYDWGSVAKKGYGLWLAKWDYDPDGAFNVPHWDVVAMRQFSNNESVAGISGRVDGNVFYGDKEQYLAYGVRKGDTPCEKLKLENEELLLENQSLKSETKSLTDSLSSLNGLYKKLLDEDKIEDKEFAELVEKYATLTKTLEDKNDALFKKDQELGKCQVLSETLKEENKALRLQEFTLGESLTFLYRAFKKLKEGKNK